MAIKQVAAKKAMENASGGKLIEASLSEIAGGWLALAVTDNGKKLVCAATKDCPRTRHSSSSSANKASRPVC